MLRKQHLQQQQQEQRQTSKSASDEVCFQLSPKTFSWPVERIIRVCVYILPSVMLCRRTRPAVTNLTLQVVPEREEIPVPLILGLDLTPTAVLDLTPRLKKTAMKRLRTMNQATKSRVENLQPSKSTVLSVRSHYCVFLKNGKKLLPTRGW